MKDSKLYLLATLLILATSAAVGVNRWADRSQPEIVPPLQVAVFEEERPVAEDDTCVSASFYGFPLVDAGDGIDVPKFPLAKRLSFDEGATQYIAKASEEEITDFYNSVMIAGCWKVSDRHAHQVLYTKDEKVVKLSLYHNPLSQKTLIAYTTGAGAVLGEATVYAAQTPSCTGDQVLCTMSGGSWCQVPPCPSSTPPSSSTTCSGTYQQPGSTSPSCNYSTCSSGCTWDSQGCPSGCYISAAPTPSGTTCTGEYQQTGSTYPMCNYSKCPNGCNYGSDGCPASCYTSSGSGSCSSGYQWCASSYSCITSGSSCGSGSATTCPSGQYWCGSTNSCKPVSDTNCSPGGGGSSCPSGQYWCNGACVANGTSCGSYPSCPSDKYMCNGACISTGSYCAPYSGTGYPDKTSCESSGGRWCQPTTSPHCHGPGDSAPCEPDTLGGGYSSCPSGQYSCNGACVSTSTSCSPSQWPMNQTDCTSQTKYWCTGNSSGGSSTYSYSSGWCQSMPCSGTSTSCGSGMYYCPSSNNCILNNITCGSPTPTACPSGQYWCSYSNGCISSTVQCTPPPPNPSPIPQPKCGQCQVVQGSSCVQAPVGTPDPLCNGGQCDMYGGCVQMSGGKKLVGQGAICGDNWCNIDKGENKENCPSDGCMNAPSASQPYPSQKENLQAPQYPGSQYPQGQYQGQQGQYSGYQGMSEEEMKRMEEERQKQQFEMMKQGVERFAKEVQRMTSFFNRMKPALTKQGIGIPQDLESALTEAPKLIAQLRGAQNFEEFEELMGTMQEVGMSMQEWGPRLGDLQRLSQMARDADKQVKEMYRAFKRIERNAKRKPELVEEVKLLEVTLGVMSKQVTEAKALMKSDPESALEKIEDFFGNTEEYWTHYSFVEMVTNLQRGLAQANTELARAKREIRALERRKDIDPESIQELKAILAGIEAMLPELKAAVNKKPIDIEDLKIQAEAFWAEIEEFENLKAGLGAGTYTYKGAPVAGIDLKIPDGFIMMPQTTGGGGFGEEGFGAPGDFGSAGGGGGVFPIPSTGGVSP